MISNNVIPALNAHSSASIKICNTYRYWKQSNLIGLNGWCHGNANSNKEVMCWSYGALVTVNINVPLPGYWYTVATVLLNAQGIDNVVLHSFGF